VFAFVAKAMVIGLGEEFLSGTLGNILWTMVSYIIMINLVLMIFNLIPCPPLDGFNIITEIFNLRTTSVYWTLYKYGDWILVGLVIFGITSKIITPIVSGIYSLLWTYIIF
jgi:membrane-associated protease RseP (regulator of RpoE activity)